MTHKPVKKTEKPAAAKSPKPTRPRKIIDVSKPGESGAPSASSRPMIVTQRPIIQDPMVARADQTHIPAIVEDKPETGLAPKSTKVHIKPLSDSNTESTVSDSSQTIDLHIPDFSLRDSPKKTESAESIPVTVSQSAPQEPVEAADAAPPEGPKSHDIPAQDRKIIQPPTADKTVPVVEPLTPPVPESSSLSGDQSGGAFDDAAMSDKAIEKEAAALEAEVKRQEELDKLVQSKEYFLPIHTNERRRSKIVTICGSVLIILLGLLLVNLLMDVGTISLDGVRPLTNFFGN
jgi:hypothetical protein